MTVASTPSRIRPPTSAPTFARRLTRRRRVAIGARGLGQDLARLAVHDDLALHPLERVVDRLRVAAELVGHVLVGRALEVHAQRVGLEPGETGAEAEDEARQLLARDHLDGG